MADSAKLYSLNDLDLHSRSHLLEKTETCALFFWQISQFIRMKFGMLLWPVSLFKFIPIFVVVVIACLKFRGENSISLILEEYLLYSLCLDMYEQVSFELGLIIDMTRLYVLISV